jgi:hypothetical protein
MDITSGRPGIGLSTDRFATTSQGAQARRTRTQFIIWRPYYLSCRYFAHPFSRKVIWFQGKNQMTI